MQKPSVFIVNDGFGYRNMFEKHGWEVVKKLEDAELVQFTGGADVHPQFYGEEKHPETQTNLERDVRERLIFSLAYTKNIPMAGICRGGQFLNVMCGGRLWQHVNNHVLGTGTHEALDIRSGKKIQVTSTHHQMMDPGPDGEVVMTAELSTWKEKCLYANRPVSLFQRQPDVEAVYYKEQQCFCFQPHPELSGYEQLAEVYLNYLFNFFFLCSDFHLGEATE